MSYLMSCCNCLFCVAFRLHFKRPDLKYSMVFTDRIACRTFSLFSRFRATFGVIWGALGGPAGPPGGGREALDLLNRITVGTEGSTVGDLLLRGRAAALAGDTAAALRSFHHAFANARRAGAAAREQ